MPLNEPLPDPPWKTGTGSDVAPPEGIIEIVNEDPSERDRAFLPVDLSIELALLHLFANATIGAVPCTCIDTSVHPCLRCRVASLLDR